ncbi:MAG: hypothetical protein AAF533_04970 [Acidobacteriota bacterium]
MRHLTTLSLLTILFVGSSMVRAETVREKRLIELVLELETLVEDPEGRRELFIRADAEGFGLEELVALARADEQRVSAEAASQGRALHAILLQSPEAENAAAFLSKRMLVPHVRKRIHQLLSDPAHAARPEVALGLLAGDLPRRNAALLIQLLADPNRDEATHGLAGRLLAGEAYWFDDVTVELLFALLLDARAPDSSRRAAVRLVAAGFPWQSGDAERLIRLLLDGHDLPLAEVLRVVPDPFPAAHHQVLSKLYREIALDDDVSPEARVVALERLTVVLSTEEHWKLLIGILETRLGQRELVQALLERIAMGERARSHFHDRRRAARDGKIPSVRHARHWVVEPGDSADSVKEKMRRARSVLRSGPGEDDPEGDRALLAWLPGPFPPAWSEADCHAQAMRLTETLHALVEDHADAERRAFRRGVGLNRRSGERRPYHHSMLASRTLRDELEVLRRHADSAERPWWSPAGPCDP